MKHRHLGLIIAALALLIIFPSSAAVNATSDANSGNQSPNTLGVGDFFLTPEEYPPQVIPDTGTYTPYAHMAVKEKLMGGQWASDRYQNPELTYCYHVTIGLFSTEADAIKYSTPDTYIFRTDAYAETGQTIIELSGQSAAYVLSGGTMYGDGGFSGGYQHVDFQPFHVFRVGRVLFHVDATHPSGEGILEPLLVNKARRLLNQEGLPEDQTITETPDPGKDTDIRVRVEASGYESIDWTYTTNGFEPSSVEIWGQIKDASGNPIANATVSLLDLGSSTITDDQGNYQLYVATVGTQPWSNQLDWTLYTEGTDGPQITLSPDAPPITPTPTPGPADLTIEDRVTLLQAIEGANFVAARDIGVLVRPYWKGGYPDNIPAGYQFKVTLTFDGTTYPAISQGPGTDFTWVIPRNTVSAGDHTVHVQAEIVGANIVDSDPSNNTHQETIHAYASRPMRLLFVRVRPTNAPAPSAAELNRLAQDAVSYLRQVYPVHAVRRVPGSYLVWTATDSRLDVSTQVAKTLIKYNNERCLEYLPDGSTQAKANCTTPKADLVVGAVPSNYYGDEAGWLYGRGSTIWGSWMDKISMGIGWIGGGGSIDRAPITVVTNHINTAHEIGHHFDLNDEYSDDLGIQLHYGLIWKDGKFTDIAYETPDYYNFMGNAGVGWPATEYWVNINTWNHILNEIISNGTVEQPSKLASVLPIVPQQTGQDVLGSALLVSGMINQAGEARIDAVEPLHRYEQVNTEQGEWKLEALNASGDKLGEINFDSYPTELSSEVPFLAVLPVHDADAVASVNLRHVVAVVATFERSPAAPTAEITQLPDLNQETSTISWNSQDADGDATTTTVLYSPNGGGTWHTLVQDTTEASVSFDPQSIPGGEVQFRIVTSDGFNQSTTLLPPISVPDHVPTVSIQTPAGTDFIANEAVILSGYADDMEDGTLPEDDLHWFDAANQEIGSGSLLHAYLPPGQHTITLATVDSTGQQSHASVVVNVTAPPAQTQTPGVDPHTGLALYDVLLLSGLCLVLFVIGGGILLFVLFLVLKRRKPAQTSGPVQSSGAQTYQDAQGNWWYRDPASGTLYFWNGQSWQVSLQAGQPQPPAFAPPQPPASRGRVQKPGRGSCVLALFAAGLMFVLVFGVVSLVGLNFFPGYTIQPNAGTTGKDILITFGGGMLIGLGGLLLLNSGFKSIITRRAVIEDDWGRRQEKRGCSAVLNGISSALFGLLLLTAGLLMASLSVFQQILPWLGF